MRTHVNILHDAKLAESSQLPVNGVKGVSPLSSIFNLVIHLLHALCARRSSKAINSGVLRLTTLKIIKWLPKEAFIHKYSYTDVTTD